MASYIWPVVLENWNVVLSKDIWAVSNQLRTKRVKKGDFIIFYVKGTGAFKGIFEVISEWYKADTPVWSDEFDREIKYPFQCKLKKIIIGDAIFNELISSLSFVKSETRPQFVLRAHAIGPANNGQPIDKNDFDIIMKKMTEPHIVKEKEEKEEIEHEDIIEKLQDIGIALGFETFTDHDYTVVGKGSVVDLVWETKIANIGSLRYVFEVQSKGSVKSLINNLIQAISNPLVKKVIAVSDKDQLGKIEEQIFQMKALSESAKSMFVYLDIEKIKNFSKFLPEFNEFRSLLHLA